MGYHYQVDGVDLTKFQTLAINGCYKNGKVYREDYAYHLLGKFQYLNHVVAEKKKALTDAKLKEIGRNVEKIRATSKYSYEDREKLNQVRKEIIEYRVALENLFDCCEKMNLDKNIKVNESMPDEQIKPLGVINYEKYHQWKDKLLADLYEMELKAKSVGSYRDTAVGINCMAYASGAKNHILGNEFFDLRINRLQEQKLLPHPNDLDTGYINNVGMQISPGIVTVPNDKTPDSEEMRKKTISDRITEAAKETLENEGFTVTGINVFEKQNNDEKDFTDFMKALPKLKPGQRRLLVFDKPQNAYGNNNLISLIAYHFAVVNPDGSLSERSAFGRVFSEKDNGVIYKKEGHIPIAFIDISDEKRLLKKYTLLRDPKREGIAQLNKQLGDLTTLSTDNKMKAEVFKEPKDTRYKTFATLGRAYIKNNGEITADDLNKTTRALQDKQNHKERDLKTVLKKVVPVEKITDDLVEKFQCPPPGYQPLYTNPALVPPLAPIIEDSSKPMQK